MLYCSRDEGDGAVLIGFIGFIGFIYINLNLYLFI